MSMREQWWLHRVSQWGSRHLSSEHVYCLTVTFKVTWVEQRICIKFCVKLELSSTETIQMIHKSFGDDAMSTAQIKVWHKCFKDGRESVASDPHSGRLATSRTPENVERVQGAMNKDWQLTVWELEADLGFPKLLCLRFWLRILARNVLWQNSFCGFCYQSRRNIVAAVANDLVQAAPNKPDVLKKVTTLKGTEASLSYVQWFLCLLSSSINISIFHSTWLDTFWTD